MKPLNTNKQPSVVKSIIVNGIVIALLCLLLFFTTALWRLNTQFAAGEEAFKKNDFSGSIAGYESAIHMYIPGSKKIERSAQQLWKIGETNERFGDVERALIAYRALRSSFYADSWLVTPGKEWIERCDVKIKALMALQKER